MGRYRGEWWLAGPFLVGVLGMLAGGCGDRAGGGAGGGSGSGDEPGATATSVDYATVLARGLPRVDLAALERLVERTAAEDRVLVLDFWATWCGICVAIFDDVHHSVSGLGEGVRLVTVTLDDSAGETRAINFLAEHGALADAYMLRPDSATQSAVAVNLGERWRDLGVPAILVFNQQGELAGEFIGGHEAEPEAIAAHVRALVADHHHQQEPDEAVSY